jgi:hypothetical protein
MDLDLLGRGDPSLKHCQAVFRELRHIPVEDDGLIFSAETVNAEKIKEEQDYKGARGASRIRMRLFTLAVRWLRG